MTDRRVPGSTYRLQLTRDFGFDAAAGLADYLARLGVTHVYLSPILQATPGSAHGYDVTDHSRISADLGGEDAFRDMVRRFREHELGVIVDIVPNHMAIPVPESLNRQLWSLLLEGPGSPYAHWFDVDWAALDGKILLPILGSRVEECVADLVLAQGPLLRYHDHELPVRSGTQDLPMAELLAAQHYELACWRDASTRLNWRRFFDITTLIGIRQEDPDVFATSHEVLFRLMREGLIDGLRVDHPDGLADPRGYFRQLAAATGGAWVVVEKILAKDEVLPADWPCAGTTGYDALALVDGLFVDPAGAGPLSAAVPPSAGGTFAEAAYLAKREVTNSAFSAELARLARLVRLAGPARPDGPHGDVHRVLVDLLASFEVYRAYVNPGEPPGDAARQAVEVAAARARHRLPQRLSDRLDAVTSAVLGAGPPELIVRFQQTTGPVVAKGVEDTACYRWPRLFSLNEVGADPDRFGVSPAEFHAQAARLAADWPATLTTLSTHDTKRQEDVRARLAVLAEHPDEWAREVAGWHEAAAAADASGREIDPVTQALVWQTLVGAWPVSAGRLNAYLTKAIREAKTHTSWIDPDEKYEADVRAFASRAPADRIAAFVDKIAPDARVNSLGAKLVQLTMPGAADVYQGCELTGYSLVDPDNRRPVDFSRRREMLSAIDGGGLDGEPPRGLDAEKLLVTSRALRLRRDHPEWFGGGYQPLAAQGPAAEHVVAFRRGQAVTVATRLPAGLRRRGGWSDTTLPLGPGQWRDVLTSATHDRPLLAGLTRDLPVALLVPA